MSTESIKLAEEEAALERFLNGPAPYGSGNPVGQASSREAWQADQFALWSEVLVTPDIMDVRPAVSSAHRVTPEISQTFGVKP